MKKYYSIYFLVLFLASFGFAQDEGLYAPAPPADAAFVRVINTTTDSLSTSIGDTSYGELAFSEVSPYRVVIQGDRTISAGDLTSEFKVEIGKFYTVVLNDGVLSNNVSILEDSTNTNRAKALLSLYNLSSIESIDLKTTDASTDVILGVAANSQNSIEVNGISVALGVFANGEALKLLDEVKLERGSAYSVVVLGTADAPTVLWVQSETTTE